MQLGLVGITFGLVVEQDYNSRTNTERVSIPVKHSTSMQYLQQYNPFVTTAESLWHLVGVSRTAPAAQACKRQQKHVTRMLIITSERH